MAERKLRARTRRRRTRRTAGACVLAVGFALTTCASPTMASSRTPFPPRPCATEPAPPSGSGEGPELVTSGSGVWSFVGPALLTWTLMKWSGAPTVEGKMKRTKPDYAAYVARTSGFVPWFPKG